MAHKATPIGEVIKSVFAQLEGEKNLTKEDIESHWKELVGKVGFEHSRPLTIRKTVLTVRVDTSAWLQEFVMKKRQLLKGLKRALGKDRISEIHFRIGEF